MSLDVNQVRSKLEQRFHDLCVQVVDEERLTLYDTEYQPGQDLLRVFIMDEQSHSATLDDCARIDRAMTPYVDSASWMPATLTLEVSSPGVYRSLKSLRHFEWAKDQRIKLVLHEKVGLADESLPKKLQRAKHLVGMLKTVTNDGVEIECEDFLLNLAFEKIKRANVEPDLGM